MAFSLGKNSEYLFPNFTNDFHPPWQKLVDLKWVEKKHKPHLVLCWFCFCSWFWHILELLFFLTRVEVVLQCVLMDFSVRFIPRKNEASTSIEILFIKLFIDDQYSFLELKKQYCTLYLCKRSFDKRFYYFVDKLFVSHLCHVFLSALVHLK